MKHRFGKTDQPLVVEAKLEPPDPHVTATLREVVGEPPYHLVDWDALRASIVGDATALFTRRFRRSWATYVVRWSRTAMPLGIAASIIAGMITVYESRVVGSSAVEAVALTPATLLNTVTGVTSRTALTASVTQSLSGTPTSDMLEGISP